MLLRPPPPPRDPLALLVPARPPCGGLPQIGLLPPDPLPYLQGRGIRRDEGGPR
jgi:hypothetical protein